MPTVLVQGPHSENHCQVVRAQLCVGTVPCHINKGTDRSLGSSRLGIRRMCRAQRAGEQEEGRLCVYPSGKHRASSKPRHPPSHFRSRTEAAEGNSQDPFDPFPVPQPFVCLSPSVPGLLISLLTPCPVDESLPLLPTPLSSVFLMMAEDELFCWPTRNKAHSMLAFFLMHSQSAIFLVSFPYPVFLCLKPHPFPFFGLM